MEQIKEESLAFSQSPLCPIAADVISDGESIYFYMYDLDYEQPVSYTHLYEEASQIIKQARENGIDKPILGPDGFDSPKLKEVAGAKALNNVYFTTHFSLKENNDKISNFLKAYKDEYGKEPDTCLLYTSRCV